MPDKRKERDGVFTYTRANGVTVYRIKYRDAAGDQVMETVGTSKDGMTRTKAKKERRQRLGEVDNGWKKPDPATFAITVPEWLAAMRAEKKWESSTEAQYVSILGRLNEWFGPMMFAGIRPSDVVAYKTAKLQKLAGATVSRDLSILHSIFAWGVVTERIDRNPSAGVPHPAAAKRKGNALRPEEVQALARAFDDEQDRLVFLTLVLTGMRRSELQAIRWEAVDLIENRLRVVDSKTETGERSIAISPSLAEELWQWRRRSPYRADGDRVFCHPEAGSVYRYETFAGALKRAYKAAELDFPEAMRCMHDLRVTSITNDAIAGANPVALMTKAGHASMATTRRYLRLAGTVFPDEAEALERRMLGVSTNPSTNLSAPEPTSEDSAPLNHAVDASAELV
jgi:integrase